MLIVTIGFGDASRFERAARGDRLRGLPASGPTCRRRLGRVRRRPSVADSACSTPDERTTENGDGDFYYCAATGSELGPIFASAINAVSSSIRLIQMP